MVSRKRRKVQLGIESLERRETPSVSGISAAFAHIAPHAVARPVLFRGAGRATVTKTTPLANGALLAQSVVAGSATALGPNGTVGPFTGIDNTVFTRGFQSYHSVAVIRASDGSQLVLNLNGTERPGTTISVGTYSVLLGTGRFKGATGQGVIVGNLALKPKLAITVNFNGILRF
jgi:hypothetical protein